ncbi:hypothetical protein Tco_0985934, partial [Tanacetum coccineum]
MSRGSLLDVAASKETKQGMRVCRTKTPSYLALGYNVGRTTLHASKPQWAAAAVAAFRQHKPHSCLQEHCQTLCLDIVYLRAVRFGRT